MLERIIIAGSGGQGIMLLGKVIAGAAMRENKFVTYLPSYGPEVRGGTAHCTVVFSDVEISSPYVQKADTLIVMNAPSFLRFKERVAAKGLLLVNSSLAKPVGGHCLAFPFTDLAWQLGNIKVANMVALGCLLGHKPILSRKSIITTIEAMAPSQKKALIEINVSALKKGMQLR
jgi:2-oxoglutarate ferredoxin oxidoreductase subunit gamma